MEDYKNFYETSAIAFWRTSFDGGQFLMANKACAELLGFASVEDLTKSDSIHFYVNGDREHILDELRNTGEIKNYKVELVLDNGKRIWVAVTGKAYPDKGYCEGSLVDVTSLQTFTDRMAEETKKLSIIQQGIKDRIKNQCSVGLCKSSMSQ